MSYWSLLLAVVDVALRALKTRVGLFLLDLEVQNAFGRRLDMTARSFASA